MPGTTWVIGSNCGWSKDGLMRWANQQGLKGINLKDARQSPAKKAADVGTVVHEMIDKVLCDQDPEPVFEATHDVVDFSDAMREQARAGFQSFRRWRAGSTLQIIATEAWGVDEGYQTGFCLDALGVEPDLDDPSKLHLALVDWKSSKGTYSDHVIQAAAYTVFVERMLAAGEQFCGGTIIRPELLEPFMGQKDLRLSGAHVLRVDKVNGMFSHKHWPRRLLDEPWAAFTWLRSLHEVHWRVEALCK